MADVVDSFETTGIADASVDPDISTSASRAPTRGCRASSAAGIAGAVEPSPHPWSVRVRASGSAGHDRSKGDASVPAISSIRHKNLVIVFLLVAGSLGARPARASEDVSPDPLRKFSDSIEALVKRVTPSVVQVLVT